MASIKLTNKAIDTVRKQVGLTGLTATLWDAQLKGFGLRVSPKGKCSWLVYKRLGTGGRRAKQVLFVFGTLSEIDLDLARDKARAIITDTRAGVDPSVVKRRKRTQEHSHYQSGKLKDVFAIYFEKNSKPGRYWTEVKRRFEVEIIPSLGPQTLIADISKQDIRALIDAKEKHTKAGARLTFAALRPFFKWCASRELITTPPTEGLSTRSLIAASRDRVLNDDEIKTLWSCIDATPYPYGPFYKLLLLTAQRRDEVAGMQWPELDLDKAIWIIPKERTKNNKEHLVHLSPQALDVLKSIAKQASRFVFTTTLSTQISSYSQAKRELDAIAGIAKPWRVHDLRRTAASGMAMLGVPPHIVERVLNHVSGSTGGLVGVYQRHEYQEERKKAIIAWSNYVENITSGVLAEANVLPFKVI